MHKKLFLSFILLPLPIIILVTAFVYLLKVNKAFAYGDVNLVLTGDSFAFAGGWYSYGWGNLHKNHIASSLNSNLTIINSGIPGDRTDEFLVKLQTNQELRNAIASADVLDLSIGFNDFYLDAREPYLNQTCGGQNNTDCLPLMVNKFASNWDQIITEIKLLNPQASIKAMNIYYPFVQTDQQNNSFSNLKPYVDSINNYIQQQSTNNYTIANINLAFNGSTGAEDPILKGYIDTDGIHPNEAGHSIIAQKFIETGNNQIDSDADLYVNSVDNCPTVYNPTQANYNSEIYDLGTLVAFDDATNPIGDNSGDACDPDIDHDRLINNQETSTSTINPDSDGDGVLDGTETICSSNPQDPTSTPKKPAGINLPDADNDQVPNTCEAIFGTNPTSSSSDTDGVNDGAEILYKGTNPLSIDTDGDGCNDGLELASVNGDRMVSSLDLGEVAKRFGATRTSPNYHYVFDVNGDGIINSFDNSFVSQRFGQACP